MSKFNNVEIEQDWEESVISSFLDLVRAPDGDFAAIGKLAQCVSDAKSLQLMVDFLQLDSQGKKAFETRLTVGDIDLEKLHFLPSDTLGYCYAEHMLSNGLKPLQAKQSENDYQYLGAHIAETHDIWHVVTGCNIDILGEIQLEAFYVAQLYATRFWLALLAKNLFKAVVYDIEISTKYMDAISKGWLMARLAKPLFGVPWNTLWETSLKDVRDSLNIVIN